MKKAKTTYCEVEKCSLISSCLSCNTGNVRRKT